MSRESAWARQRKRRVPRRESKRGASYTPILLPPNAASRGVQARLLGAAFFGFITASCLFALFALHPAQYTMLALIITAIGSLVGSISLIMSARREELVHQLASDLAREDHLLEYHAPGDGEGWL